MAGIEQVSPIQHVDNEHSIKNLQEQFGITQALLFLTLQLLSLAVSLALFNPGEGSGQSSNFITSGPPYCETTMASMIAP
jgi:hypothetical protein